MLPGKDFVRGLKRLIDENEPRTGSYEDFIIGLLLYGASSVLENYVTFVVVFGFEGVVGGWVEFGEVWDMYMFVLAMGGRFNV